MLKSGAQCMSTAAGVLLMVAAMAIVTGTVLQVVQFRRGRDIVSRGQLVRRLLMAVLLLAVIGMLFYGAVYPWPDPLTALKLVAIPFVLVIIVIFLAMSDLRAVERLKHLRQAELYRTIQDIQDAHKKHSRETKQ